MAVAVPTADARGQPAKRATPPPFIKQMEAIDARSVVDRVSRAKDADMQDSTLLLDDTFIAPAMLPNDPSVDELIVIGRLTQPDWGFSSFYWQDQLHSYVFRGAQIADGAPRQWIRYDPTPNTAKEWELSKDVAVAAATEIIEQRILEFRAENPVLPPPEFGCIIYVNAQGVVKYGIVQTGAVGTISIAHLGENGEAIAKNQIVALVHSHSFQPLASGEDMRTLADFHNDLVTSGSIRPAAEFRDYIIDPATLKINEFKVVVDADGVARPENQRAEWGDSFTSMSLRDLYDYWP